MITCSELKGLLTGWRLVLLILNLVLAVESLILIGISTLGKHSTFLGTLPLLTGIQFCGGILLVPVTLCIFGLARKEREFLTTRKYFLALILAYAIILGVQVSVTVACFTITEEEKARMITKSWEKASEAERYRAEVASDCCGFKNAFHEQGICAEVAHIYGGLTSTVPPCFDVMSDAADAAFMSSGIMSVFTAVTEVATIIVIFLYRRNLDPSQERIYSVST